MSVQPVLPTPGDLYDEVCPRKSPSWWRHNIQFCGLCEHMASSTMKVCHCGQRLIVQGALHIPQLSIMLLVDRLVHRYRATHIWSHTTAYYCYVRFYIPCSTVCPGPYCWWLQLQRRGGLASVWVSVLSHQAAHSRKSLSFDFNWIESHQAEVFVEP